MTTVYTKPNCINCEKTKNLLNELDLDYVIIDITQSKEALALLKEKGFREAPVIITETDSWSGFNEEKIRALQNNNRNDDDIWA